MYVFTLCGLERVRLYISVARKFSEAIRQVNPGPLARLQSSQQQARLWSENMCTWYWTIARPLFLKCGATLALTLLVGFIGCCVTFRFPSGLAIPT